MSKTFRLNFEKGINVVGDKALLPDGFVTILDNVDLRSGSPRPYRAPEFQFQVPDNTTRSWSYRNRWFHSANDRDYVGEFIGGIERVYITEEGLFPTKAVEGDVVLLGTPRPKTILGVSKSSSLSPGNFKAEIAYAGEGNLADGDRYYRITAKTADGTLPPSPPIVVTIADKDAKGASVKLTWSAVSKAISYTIYEGDASNQLFLDEVVGSILQYKDTGTKVASGDNATQYLQEQSFTYAYTYRRNVNGVYDESGLSALSIPMTGATGRIITRDYLNDGYWLQTQSDGTTLAAISGTGTIANTSATAFPPKSLTGVAAVYNNASLITAIHLVAHGFVTGDKLKFSGFDDPTWSEQTLEVIYIDADHFGINNIKVPTDGSPLPAGTTAQLVKCIVTYTALGVVADNDVVNLVGTGTGTTVSGLYKATRIDDMNFSVPLLATAIITLSTVKWVPLNGYYDKWLLYRNEQGGWFQVDEVDLSETTYTDGKPFAALGGTPSSYYSENGITVDYDTPPVSMTSVESHYGMLFAISGHTVRWTPILTPDAWPEVFSVTLAYKPVKVVSFAQGLIILCQDAIYRLDGNSPTQMSLSKTHAEDGCYAPGTVQKTDKGLMYLSRRGIMMFDGTQAQCITDTRIPGAVINGPSKTATPVPFWWLPTTMTKNYADLAGEDSISSTQYVFNMDNTKVIDGMNKSLKSMYHQGKYYLFFTGDNYQGNTSFVVDMQLPGFPITTMGSKVTDCHVDEFENAYLLFDNAFSTKYEASKSAIPGGDPQLIGRETVGTGLGWSYMEWSNGPWSGLYLGYGEEMYGQDFFGVPSLE